MGRSTVQLHTGKTSACQKEEDEQECRPEKDYVITKDRDEGSGDQDPPEYRPWQKKLLADPCDEDHLEEAFHLGQTVKKPERFPEEGIAFSELVRHEL
jgi:hypothetical protein